MRDLSFFPGCMCPLTKKRWPQPGPPIKTSLEPPLPHRFVLIIRSIQDDGQCQTYTTTNWHTAGIYSVFLFVWFFFGNHSFNFQRYLAGLTSAEKKTLRKINTGGDGLVCELVHQFRASLSINVVVAGDGGSRHEQSSWAKAVIQLPAVETCVADKWDTSCAPAACSGSALGVFSQLNVLRIPLKREFLEAC